jgi:hypothetical protein
MTKAHHLYRLSGQRWALTPNTHSIRREDIIKIFRGLFIVLSNIIRFLWLYNLSNNIINSIRIVICILYTYQHRINKPI